MEFISFAKDAFEALKKKKKKCRLQREVTETPGYTALPPLCPVRAAHQKYSSFNYDLVISKINYFPENEECVGGIGKRESSQVSFPEGHRAPRLGGRRGRLRHKTSGAPPAPSWVVNLSLAWLRCPFPFLRPTLCGFISRHKQGSQSS